MTISLQRKKLHQVLDSIPERHLNKIQQYLARLTDLQQPFTSDLESADVDHALLALVEKIQQTPVNPTNITPPTKLWEEYVPTIVKSQDATF